MSCTLFEKKRKRGRTGLKKKERRKAGRKQANSQLAKIEFLVGEVPSVE